MHFVFEQNSGQKDDKTYNYRRTSGISWLSPRGIVSNWELTTVMMWCCCSSCFSPLLLLMMCCSSCFSMLFTAWCSPTLTRDALTASPLSMHPCHVPPAHRWDHKQKYCKYPVKIFLKSDLFIINCLQRHFVGRSFSAPSLVARRPPPPSTRWISTSFLQIWI